METLHPKNCFFFISVNFRPNETVRREIVAELLIQFIHGFNDKSDVPYLNVIMEVFFREAAAGADSTQTSEELRKTMHQGNSELRLFLIGTKLLYKI